MTRGPPAAALGKPSLSILRPHLPQAAPANDYDKNNKADQFLRDKRVPLQPTLTQELLDSLEESSEECTVSSKLLSFSLRV